MYLFKKNIFSAPSPVFSILSVPETEKLTAVIKRHYENIVVKEIYGIGAFELNSSNWKVVTANSIYILKRADLSKHKTLSAQAEWTVRISDSSFPSIQFVPDKQGKLISSDADHCYCLTFFENGNYFGSSLEQWPTLVAAMKTLYDASFNNPRKLQDLPERSFFTNEEDLLVGKLKNTGKVEGIENGHLERILSEYEKSRALFENNKHNYHNSIFHVDIHPHNLIFENKKLKLLTDFESFQNTTIEISLGFGLYKCMRQLMTLNEAATASDHKKIALQLKAEFQLSFPEKSLAALIVLGKTDVLKRLLYIMKELTEKGSSKWSFIFQTQFEALEEIDELEKLVS